MSIRVAEALRRGGCAPVIAVGDPVGARGGALADAWSAVSCDPRDAQRLVVPDRWPGEGPLGATLSALIAVDQAPGVVVAACDLPWLSSDAVRAVIGATTEPQRGSVWSPQVRHGAVAGVMVPLIWWPIRVRSVVQDLFDAGERSLRAALDILGAAAIEIAPESGRDVDRPEDLKW